MVDVFVAYASINDFHGTIIKEACQQASIAGRKVVPWSEKDTSGHPIAKSVESWIETADAFVADISHVNANVTYELGFAIGLGKPVRLIRSEHGAFETVKAIGLLDTLGHDLYMFQPALAAILRKSDITLNWEAVSRNKDQPVFILQPPEPTDYSIRATSAVKKIARLRFRNFNPLEISRLSATEAYEFTLSSYGVIAFWTDDNSDEAIRANQRASFVLGLARGAGIPALLIAHDSSRLPLDLHDQAARWVRFDDIDGLVSGFRDEVADAQNELADIIEDDDASLLDTLNFGDPVAENEATILKEFFLQTDAYRSTLDGRTNVLVGRKGSGKTAIFITVRDRCRSNKNNIVVDLMPDGYQLIKLKEFVLDRLAFGTKKEVIAAFWEYVLWLEIAYKILEKDQHRVRRDYELLIRYEELEGLFRKRVDTGLGDFTERLKILTENLVDRFTSTLDDKGSNQVISSEVLESVYGQDIAELRNAILSYLKLKGFVLFLFDNLDRVWTPGGFNDDDAVLLIGLIEAMQELTRKFTRGKLDFRWALFVRSDVYEFLVRGMADYGKLAVHSLEWSDRDQMKALFQHRLEPNLKGQSAEKFWKKISVAFVDGKPVLDFLVDGSLMRPRYLIRLFETARRRAVTFGRSRIEEEDYRRAIEELGWQVLEDLDREVSDLVADGSNLLWELINHREGLTAEKLRYLAGKKITDETEIERLIDVMLWNGSLGVKIDNDVKFIFDTGYKRQYLASAIGGDKNIPLVLHPTLCAAVQS